VLRGCSAIGLAGPYKASWWPVLGGCCFEKDSNERILRIKEKSFEEAWKYGGELLNDGSIYDLRRIEQTPLRARRTYLNDLIEKMRATTAGARV